MYKRLTWSLVLTTLDPRPERNEKVKDGYRDHGSGQKLNSRHTPLPSPSFKKSSESRDYRLFR